MTERSGADARQPTPPDQQRSTDGQPTASPSDFRPPILAPRERSSGLLLHLTSLPGPGGVGSLGASAYRFVDFLAAAGQTRWQIMPLGPVGLGNSPYAARSAFAGNALLVDVQTLVDWGWLEPSAVESGPGGRLEAVQYEAATAYKEYLIGRANERFHQQASADERAELEAFLERNRAWLPDFALFMALKEVRGNSAWFQWSQALVRREPAALEQQRRELAERVERHQFGQFLFDRQWRALKRYAGERAVKLIGDIPIFVAHDSADVWVNQEIFFLDEQGQATVVAGVPPDAFSATGQRWGNPLYRWDRLAERGFDWWVERFRLTLEQVDVVRLDHFRGFEAYWEVPGHEQTAEHGQWVAGPGVALFEAVERALGSLPIVVEDLGLITPEVEQLRLRLGLPGMKVLQFAFGDDATNPYLPHNHIQDCVVYTGTHDNDTTLGWYQRIDERERHRVRSYLGVNGQDIAWDLIRSALISVADTAIVPLQDVLGLDNRARMNFPGQADGNWAWRYRDDQLRPALAERLGELTEQYGRLPQTDQPPATATSQ